MTRSAMYPGTFDPMTLGHEDLMRRAGRLFVTAASLRVPVVSVMLRRGYGLGAMALTALPGIGDWSAQLIALRTLGWPDAWPAADIALLKALGQTTATRDPAAGTAIAEAWRPWRGYAVFKLWLSLETP